MTYIYTEYDYLAHHGVKGMKWGVRRERLNNKSFSKYSKRYGSISEKSNDIRLAIDKQLNTIKRNKKKTIDEMISQGVAKDRKTAEKALDVFINYRGAMSSFYKEQSELADSYNKSCRELYSKGYPPRQLKRSLKKEFRNFQLEMHDLQDKYYDSDAAVEYRQALRNR